MMKFALFHLHLLALALALTPLHARAADPVPFRFLVTAVTVQESEPFARLEVLRADDADHPIKVDFLSEPLTATPGADYTPVAGTLTFAPGEHFKLIEVPILNDGLTEPTETFRVVLTNATENGISESFGVATITIRDNDPGLSFDSATYLFTEASGEVLVNVVRGADAPGTITVDYSVEPDTASPQLDYVPINGTLVFGPEDQIKTIHVAILQDNLTEPTETFRVLLSNPSAGVSLHSANPAIVRILDNDQGFTFPATSFTVVENQGELALSVLRSADTPGVTTVDYSTEPISATPDLDYTPMHGTLVFESGQSTATIKIPILNDGLKEPIETFRVILSNPGAGAFLAPQSTTTVRILDNDTGFLFSGGSIYSVSESDGDLLLPVNRGSDASAQVSVDYSLEPASATPDLDYIAAKGTLVFGPNDSSQTIRVAILNDILKESIESLRVVLSNPSPGTSLGFPNVATVRISDDDFGFAFNSSTYSVSESQKEVILYVNRLTNPLGESSVDFSVEPDSANSANSATPGLDYLPVNGTLVFHNGESSKTISVPILIDSLKEPTETFRVLLANPSAGTVLGSPSAVTVRILDDDPGFSFAGPTYYVTEGLNDAALTVNRGTDSSTAASVEYSTEPDSATQGLDYTPVSGILSFAPNESSKTILMPILNDGIAEGNELFRVVLSNPSPGTFLGTPAQATVIIQDNDLGFMFEAVPPYYGTLSEAAGEARVDVVIRGDFVLTNSVSVDFSTEPSTAKANLDYLTSSGTLVFAPGETRKTVSIPLINDGLFEADEVFRVALSNPVGLPIAGPTRFTFTIQDNEFGYVFERSPDSDRFFVRENSGDVLLNLYREGDFNFTSSVHFRIYADGGALNIATSGQDFLAGSGTVTFGPGETNKPIALHLLDDHRAELGEQVFIELSDPTPGVNLRDSQGVVEIKDNEHNPLRIDPDFHPEVPYPPDSGGDHLRVLPDGRIVMGTPLWRLTGEDGLGIVRLWPDGRLDTNFQMAGVSSPFLRALAIHTNGSVFVAGDSGFTVNGEPVQQVARLNPNGSFDPGFRAMLQTNQPSVVTSLSVQSDAKLLVATSDSRLVRLNPDGALDSSFQTVSANANIRRMELDQEHRIVIQGDSFSTINGQNRPGLARLLPDGSLDPVFLSAWPSVIYGFELYADGGLLISFDDGNGGSRLARVTSDGLMDPTFKSSNSLGFNTRFFAPNPEGKFLISQTSFGWTDQSALITWQNADGSPDETFQPVTYFAQPSGGWGGAPSLTREPAGDLLIKNVTTVNGQRSPGLARMLLNSPAVWIEVDENSPRVVETNALVTVQLVRTGDTSAPFTVNWATEGGTARAGEDYEPASGTLTFGIDESEKTIALRLLDNNELDDDRSVKLRLTTPAGSSSPAVSLTIQNDDLGFVPGGSYSFPNGRFIMNLTGFRHRTNVRIQRSTDLRQWEEWTGLGSDSQVMDYEASTTGQKQQFYRLISD
jgi:uncharacterized delta-60 repeat protein